MRLRLVALIFALVAGCDARGSEGPAVLVASVVESDDEALFGGFSGIHLGPDGRDIILISDRGAMLRGTLDRDGDERPLGLRDWTLVPFAVPPALARRQDEIDTEGLTVTDEGIFVSIEGIHAVWRFAPDGHVEERLPQHPAFRTLQHNASLEALASDADGALYVLAERSEAWTRPNRVWRYADGEWTDAFDLPRRGGFLPVGADFGPDGLFYLLERRAILPFGFATRVRRFEVDGADVGVETTLLETEVGTHDNLEGLSVWRDGTGAIRLTMVSDDNYFMFQETQIVEYRLPPELDAEAEAR